MVFCSTDLAARIERAECSMLAEVAGNVQQRQPGAGALCLPLAGGIATWVGPDAPSNKVAGLGFGGSLDLDQLAAVERAFAARDTPLHVELSCLADPAIAAALTGRGYALVGFENVLGLRLPAVPQPARAFEIVEVTHDDADLIDVMLTGFATPDTAGVPSHESFPREAMLRALRNMGGLRGLAHYLARVDGEAAAGGSMRVSDGIAQLNGSATLPAFRRRGLQTAMLARRLADAARASCDLAVITTLPGSKSQENAQRRGFALLYTRAILRAPAAGPGA